MTEKTMTIRLDEELHKRIKLKAVKEGKTVKDYILNLVKQDLEKEEKKNV